MASISYEHVLLVVKYFWFFNKYLYLQSGPVPFLFSFDIFSFSNGTTSDSNQNMITWKHPSHKRKYGKRQEPTFGCFPWQIRPSQRWPWHQCSYLPYPIILAHPQWQTEIFNCAQLPVLVSFSEIRIKFLFLLVCLLDIKDPTVVHGTGGQRLSASPLHCTG